MKDERAIKEQYAAMKMKEKIKAINEPWDEMVNTVGEKLHSLNELAEKMEAIDKPWKELVASMDDLDVFVAALIEIKKEMPIDEYMEKSK